MNVRNRSECHMASVTRTAPKPVRSLKAALIRGAAEEVARDTYLEERKSERGMSTVFKSLKGSFSMWKGNLTFSVKPGEQN